MDKHKQKAKQRFRRARRVRNKITGTAEHPRLSVFRSSKHIYAQLIDDVGGVTLAAASSRAKDVRAGVPYGGNVKAAAAVGKALAQAASARGIKTAAFDRGHYKFHGRVKALAEAANAAGLKCCEPRHPPKAPPAEAAKPAKGAKAEKGAPAEGKKPKKEKPAES
jgi:large subunit ribosomal protein L18